MKADILQVLLVIMLAAGAAAMSESGQVRADHVAPAGSYGSFPVREDIFYTWDFMSLDEGAGNVDWPVTMIFRNAAEIDRVKDALRASNSELLICGDQFYAYLTDEAGPEPYVWDSDRGIKNDCGGRDRCVGGFSSHMRLYADQDDELYNVDWGYYVIGTTHWDSDHMHIFPPECPKHEEGFSESAEADWRLYSDNVPGWQVTPESWNLGNAVPYTYVSSGGEHDNHIMDSSGLATDVVVPPPVGDSDNDGCSDVKELQTSPGSETSGGLRDPLNPYDFYDVVGQDGGERDKLVDLPNDIFGVILRWSANPELPYDATYDRGPSPPGSYIWSKTAPDGVIDLPNDIFGVLAQWQHNCT